MKRKGAGFSYWIVNGLYEVKEFISIYKHCVRGLDALYFSISQIESGLIEFSFCMKCPGVY